MADEQQQHPFEGAKVVKWPPLYGSGPAPGFWFTSDLHVGHKKAADLRGFGTTEAMDYQLLRNINAVVKREDHLFITGDLSFKGTQYTNDWLTDITCENKYLVCGNHDNEKGVRKIERHFRWIRDLTQIRVSDPDAEDGRQRIVLCHFPVLVWDKVHKGAWMLHGHCHGNLRVPFTGRIWDIGIDTHPELRPWSYAELKTLLGRMDPDVIDYLDHHKPKKENPDHVTPDSSST